MTKDLIISVVAPLYNQRDRIVDFINTVTPILEENFQNYELILVDDGSSDGTVEMLRNSLEDQQNIRVLVLSRHYGKEIALTAGLDHAIGDYIILMNSNLHDPPELIPDLMKHIQKGFDVVYVAKDSSSKNTPLYRLATSLFYRLIPHLTGLEIKKDATDYRALSRRVANSITRLKEYNRYMRMFYAYVGFKVGNIPFPRGTQQGTNQGTSYDYSYRKKLLLALDAIINFSDKPLRYIALLSLSLSFIGLLGSIYVIISKLLSDQLVEGWASLMVVQLLMFSVLFMFLAVISEYISRILVESKHRPLYYIREEYGGTNLKIDNIVDID